MDWLTLQVLTVLLLATLIRCIFGFGEALVAVPLLAFIMPIEVAAPIAALVSITVAAAILLKDWSEVHVRSALPLVVSTLFGIPLGLLFLTKANETVVKGILASVIIGFCTFSLIQKKTFRLQNDRLAWLFGLTAGVLGGAYGMNGPPLIVYGTLQGWSPRRFRATLQGYFLPASVVVMGGYWAAGLWTVEVNRYYLLSLPVIALAIYAGNLVNRRINGPRFLFFVHVALAATGILLWVQALSTA